MNNIISSRGEDHREGTMMQTAVIYAHPWRRDADRITAKDAILTFCGVRQVRRMLFPSVKVSSEEKMA
ncbi:hypothetical protein VSK92_21360 [Bacillus swezeyi]|uniref:hypothetical protein n=3 Tax=Bacillus swezeyi TaxID=1925020 RepID=UPI0039C5C165